MAERLYGLTERTAGDLKQLLGDGGSILGGATSAPAARGSTWVKVTSGTATSGWYPGVVSLDYNGTFTDLTAAVKIASADGTALVNGNRYLCTRTGDDSGGARFRTVALAAPTFTRSDTLSGGTPPFATTLYNTWVDTGTVLLIPSAGLYLVHMTTSGFATQTFGTPSTWPSLSSRLHDGTAAVGGTTGTVVTGSAATVYGTHSVTVPYLALASVSLKVQIYQRTSGGTDSMGLSSLGDGSAAARIQWVKLS